MGLRLEEVPSLPIGVPAVRQVFLLSTGRFLHNSALKHLPVFSAAPEERHLAGRSAMLLAPPAPAPTFGSLLGAPRSLDGGNDLATRGANPFSSLLHAIHRLLWVLLALGPPWTAASGLWVEPPWFWSAYKCFSSCCYFCSHSVPLGFSAFPICFFPFSFCIYTFPPGDVFQN